MPGGVLATGAALAMALALLLACAATGSAQPADFSLEGEAREQVESLSKQAADVQAQIDELDRRLEITVEEHNATRVRLDELTMELADSRIRLEKARAQYQAQEELMSQRLVAIYKADEVNVFTIILNSDSFDDFLNQTYYITKVSREDAKMKARLEDYADEIESITNEIDAKRAEQMRLEERAGEQEAAIKAQIAERQAVYDSLDAQMRQIIDRERERQRLEREKAAAEAREMLKELEVSDRVQAEVIITAIQYLGVPYVWGGESPQGFDCSGLTKYVFAQHGVELPHNAAMQFQLGVPVPREELQPGDLVFWGPGNPHHVAIYIGNDQIIEAPSFGQVVTIAPMDYGPDYAGARRFPLRLGVAAP